MKKYSIILFIVCAVFILFSAQACKMKSSEMPLDEAEQAALEAEQAEEEAAAAEAAQKPAPPPRMTDDVYVEITARSVLIRDKYKDDMAIAEKEVEAVYEKFGVTFSEYKDFEKKLTPQSLSALQIKINDFIQKIVNEYK